MCGGGSAPSTVQQAGTPQNAANTATRGATDAVTASGLATANRVGAGGSNPSVLGDTPTTKTTLGG